MKNLTHRDKQLLHMLFAPDSILELVEKFGNTSVPEWTNLYGRLLGEDSQGRGLILYVDGAADLENETAAIGGVIYAEGNQAKEGAELHTFSQNIGKATNNQAEYCALIEGLKYARQLNATRIAAFSDSELLVKQVNLEYKVKNRRILQLLREVQHLLNQFESWEVGHISRRRNRKADILSKQALLEGKRGD